VLALKISTEWHDVPVADFLLVPVASIAWLARSRMWGYVAAAVAAAITVPMAHAGAATAPLAAAYAGAAVRLVFYLIVVALIGEVGKLVATQAEEARVDGLTGAANVRAFREAATREIERALRYPQPLSLLYLDVDDFKLVNDTFGHGDGDGVLRTVGHVMRCAVRSTDLVARLGGDEFAALMPHTDTTDARQVAHRIREDLARVTLPDGRRLRCSIGVATLVSPPEDVDELLRRADHLMYHAKMHGKDRIAAA